MVLHIDTNHHSCLFFVRIGGIVLKVSLYASLCKDDMRCSNIHLFSGHDNWNCT